MTPDMEALGRRAVACARFPEKTDYGSFGSVGWRETDSGILWCKVGPEDRLPDFSDAATTGRLLPLVREAWGDAWLHLVPYRTHDQPNGPGTDLVPALWWALARCDGSLVEVGPHQSRLAGATPADALMSALDAAPSDVPALTPEQTAAIGAAVAIIRGKGEQPAHRRIGGGTPVPAPTLAAKSTRLYKCRACGVQACTRTVINDIHDDARYQCISCGHTWVHEGPDA